MLYTFRGKFENYPLLADFLYALFFGVLSLGLGVLRFEIPGSEGGATDFREIPLIISVFYIRNPFFLVFACILTSVTTAENGSVITTFVMHILPILITWWFYNRISNVIVAVLTKGLVWVLFVLVYYFFLLIPVMLFSDKLVGINTNISFGYYFGIMGSVKLEMVATALITGLYLVQFDTREKLKLHQKDLELLVANRTAELASANKKLTSMNDELISSSEEIKSMNKNLDGLVKERSKKIEDQLNLLIRYTHMNSHEVRAPLARILGLLEIIKLEKTITASDKVVNDLCKSGNELDQVVKDMNRLLEKEIDSDEIT